MLASTARAIAEHAIEMARCDAEQKEAMGTANEPTPAELEREARRAWARQRDREIWISVTLPQLQHKALLAQMGAI